MRDLAGFVETRQQLLTLKPNHRMNWIGFAVSHHLNSKYSFILSLLLTKLIFSVFSFFLVMIIYSDKLECSCYSHSELFIRLFIDKEINKLSTFYFLREISCFGHPEV